MEPELEQAIGIRIRTLRQEKALTLDDLAAASGVSRAMISRIERAEASPTASLLARICAALGLSLSAFFAEEGQASPLARRQEQQVWRDPETGYIRRSVSPPGTASDVDIVEVEFPAGARVSFPPHASAHGMTQHIWLFDGELEMTAAEMVYRLRPGDCLFMPVGEGHVFHNPGNTPARYCVVLDRGGR
ncbi:helix-turn-helix domain-containing protein [Rhizobium leguminosarum]|uniref:helix-turn-helix domain-containing protein n=1 Tax=Rhizobium leguminosarum TaxID=384 RepID=UPI00103A9036|nr:XRE family transcriptional regulator [Rhizobium leguminosarum]MBA9030847.1 transcriptional regulator with XRE-family HTH domain [Rhizobium leguminosarum]MDI5928235.1 XRE family transcriptional regulator [Rhizobium leguminosarum]NKJ90751.1 helix-turn-helix domain-containing protein [Rhizobium leguminosarum bv. viciae]QIO59080.1 helix-turn-helix domain-containing protein [Rhizobium leguminosarum bv. trifolii]TBZ72873.1 XRE family transcriptional regulator [Rhizobium leguminosarum bv. viciae]